MDAKSNPTELVESIVGDFFGANRKADKEERPGGESGGREPALTGISQVIGAAVGGFFGGPLGAQAGAAVGSFAGDQASKGSSVPQGPGATISGGTVDTSGDSDKAGQVAEQLQQLAVRGLQTRAAPQGRGKVF